MSKQIGVGVISLGWMGRLHARSYRALAERYQGLEAEVRLVAACDPVEAARDEASRPSGSSGPTPTTTSCWPIPRSTW